jgi:hypothetical protein
VRPSFVEGLCLVAIGVAMVELHDGRRIGRPGIRSETTLATAAKPAAAAGLARSPGVVNRTPNEGLR